MRTPKGDLTPPPFVPWAQFLDGLQWRQGEHVSLVGPTGTGKTTLMRSILRKRTDRRGFVTVLGTKPRDAVLNKLRTEDGYRRVDDWPPRPGERKVLLWPSFSTPAAAAIHAPLYRRAIEDCFTSESWCVACDEARYLVEHMGLAQSLKLLWTQGRSVGVSLVTATQRPVIVPLDMYDAATHLFLWRDNDEANLRRVGGLGGLDAQRIRWWVAGLERHVALYVNTRTGQVSRVRPDHRS